MQNTHSRSADPDKQLEWLEQKHARLKEEVAALGSRFYRTPAEELELRNLKKEKLRTKDTMMAIRRETESLRC